MRTPRHHQSIAALAAFACVTAAAIVAGGAITSATADPACTSTWIGAPGASWSFPANWSPTGAPNIHSYACVLAAGGPRVVNGTAGTLYARGTTIMVIKQLTVHASDIADSSLGGDGTFTSYRSSMLSGVKVSGSLTVNAGRAVSLTGARSMCGGELALCLNGASRLVGNAVTWSGGDIGGTSSAATPMTAKRLFVTDGAANGSYRVGVPLSAQQVFNNTTTAGPAHIVLTRWDELTSDGTLTGLLFPSVGGITVPNAINTIGRTGLLEGTNVVEPDGQFAGAGLSVNDGFLNIAADVSFTPAGGALVSTGIIAIAAYQDSAPKVSINGNLQFSSVTRELDVPAGAELDVTGAFTDTGPQWLVVEGAVTTSTFHLRNAVVVVRPTGRLTAGAFDVHGSDDVDVDVDGGGQLTTSNAQLSIPDGGYLNTDGGCAAALTVRLALSAGSHTVSRLYSTPPNCPRGYYQVTGSASINGELILDCNTATLGDQRVVLRATAGLVGRFSSVTGDVNIGPNHWEISYTATEVLATLVAGNV